MGWDYEIRVWQRQPGCRAYAWETIWTGNSRVRLLLALIPAVGARKGRPLQVIYR